MSAVSEEAKAHAREAHKAWYQAHREERLAKQKAYRESHREQVSAGKKKCYEAKREHYIAAVKANYRAHPEEKAARSRQYRRDHLDDVKATKRAYYELHKTEIYANHRAYCEAHKEETAAYLRAWHEAHPEEWREILRRARLRRRRLFAGRICDLTAAQWRAIQKVQEYRCAACGEMKPLTQDHIVPISLGGHHTADNIQGLCQSCNSHKHTRVIDYRARREDEWRQLRLPIDA